jgi:hypothetical protein
LTIICTHVLPPALAIAFCDLANAMPMLNLPFALAVADSGNLDMMVGARVVVFGSSKPWYESIAIALGAEYVATVEYLPMHFDYNQNGSRIETFLVNDPALHSKRGTFDVAISISSFEHDGLGRFNSLL